MYLNLLALVLIALVFGLGLAAVLTAGQGTQFNGPNSDLHHKLGLVCFILIFGTVSTNKTFIVTVSLLTLLFQFKVSLVSLHTALLLRRVLRRVRALSGGYISSSVSRLSAYSTGMFGRACKTNGLRCLSQCEMICHSLFE